MAKTRYHVDLFEAGLPDEWRKCRSLKKAVRFAKKHGITAPYILDKDGNSIPDLNLDDPQWDSHRELEKRFSLEEVKAIDYRQKLERERDAYRNRQVTMIKAGYIPIELIISRLIDFQLEHTPVETTTWGSRRPEYMNGQVKATITLNGTQGEQASQYKCSPWSAFLSEINEGWKR